MKILSLIITLLLSVSVSNQKETETIILRPNGDGEVQEWVGATSYKYINDEVSYPPGYPYGGHSCDDSCSGKPLDCEWTLPDIPKTDGRAKFYRLWVLTDEAELESANIKIDGKWMGKQNSISPGQTDWDYFDFPVKNDLSDGVSNIGFRCTANSGYPGEDTSLKVAYVEVHYETRCDCGCNMFGCNCKEGAQ